MTFTADLVVWWSWIVFHLHMNFVDDSACNVENPSVRLNLWFDELCFAYIIMSVAVDLEWNDENQSTNHGNQLVSLSVSQTLNRSSLPPVRVASTQRWLSPCPQYAEHWQRSDPAWGTEGLVSGQTHLCCSWSCSYRRKTVSPAVNLYKRTEQKKVCNHVRLFFCDCGFRNWEIKKWKAGDG